MGARAAGLGYAAACLSDEWSMLNNIGGLSKVEAPVAAFSFDSQPSFKPFNRMAAVIAVPIKYGVSGASLFRFGDALYSEQIVSLGFSNTFGLASLGIRASYVQYNASGLGTKGVFTVSFGGIATVTKNISIGAYIININQPEISKDDGEKVPTRLMLGVRYKVSEQAMIITEAEKDLQFPLRLKGGVEYQPYKKFVFRSAFQLYPGALFFGFGFHPRKVKVDYAYQHSFAIGSRHQATIAYHFPGK
jgi:hypothetical protein